LVDGDVDLPRGLAYSFSWRTANVVSMDDRILCSDHSLLHRSVLWLMCCCRRCSFFARRQHAAFPGVQRACEHGLQDMLLVNIHYVIGRFSGRCVAAVDAHSSLDASMDDRRVL